jgi:ATP-dependent helicase HepA
VPYVVGTASEVLARWYHEGLNAFADHIGGTAALADCLGGELSALLRDPEEVRLRNFLQRSHIEAERISGELSRGYEKLLEMNSLRPRMAARIASEIRRWDSDRGFETFVLRILDFFGVNCDELADRTYHLRAGNLLTDSFPEIPEDGMRVTFDRDRALSREDLAFFTAEHPFVTSVIELMLSGEWGNASLAASRSTDGNPDLLLEMDAIAEVVASPAINVSRFLPPRPIRVVVDAEGSDRTVEAYDAHRRLRTADPARLAEPDGTLRRALPEMIDAALEIASNTLANIVADAERTAFDAFEAEIARLEDLREINPDVSIEEIEGMKLLQVSVAEAIARARLRVGGLRAVLVLDGS